MVKISSNKVNQFSYVVPEIYMPIRLLINYIYARPNEEFCLTPLMGQLNISMSAITTIKRVIRKLERCIGRRLMHKEYVDGTHHCMLSFPREMLSFSIDSLIYLAIFNGKIPTLKSQVGIIPHRVVKQSLFEFTLLLHQFKDIANGKDLLIPRNWLISKLNDTVSKRQIERRMDVLTVGFSEYFSKFSVSGKTYFGISNVFFALPEGVIEDMIFQ